MNTIRGWAENVIGWLIKKGLCHSSATWHALNSTFPGTKLHCFLPDKRTLDNYFMTLKSSTRDISWRARKTDEGSPVSPGQCSYTQFCGCNGCCAWLWLSTSWSASIFSRFGTIWLFFCSPTWNNHTWLGSSLGPIVRSYPQLGTFSRIGMRALYHGNPSAATTIMEEVCVPQGETIWTIAV